MLPRRRRFQPRSLLIATAALSVAIGLLVLSMVGFGHTIGFLDRLTGTPLLASAESASSAKAPPGWPPPVPTGAPAIAPPPLPIAVPQGAVASVDGATVFGGGGSVSDSERGGPNATASAGVSAVAGTTAVGGATQSTAGTRGTATQDTAAGATPGATAGAPQGPACGPKTCGPEQVCCNASCGICTAPGAMCTQQRCDLPNAQTSLLCGPNTCNVGQVCCNASCGICAAPGAACDQRTCRESVQYPSNERCGSTLCNAGQVCCNPSCGICAAPGASCSRDICR